MTKRIRKFLLYKLTYIPIYIYIYHIYIPVYIYIIYIYIPLEFPHWITESQDTHFLYIIERCHKRGFTFFIETTKDLFVCVCVCDNVFQKVAMLNTHSWRYRNRSLTCCRKIMYTKKKSLVCENNILIFHGGSEKEEFY